MRTSLELVACSWPGTDPQMRAYHDTEWGVPLHDDQKLFEYMVLDTFQAGLSWQIVLRKREGFRKAFADFVAERVADFGEEDVARLVEDTGIVRNRAKIRATIGNARAFLLVREEFGSFDRYIWQFVGGTPIVNHWQNLHDLPATSPESDAMSRDLKARGFAFVGSTICYAFMQAAGMVNDHIVSCPRHSVLQKPITA